MKSELRAIVFLKIVNFEEFKRIGSNEPFESLNSYITSIIGKYDGDLVKTLSDTLLLSFTSSTAALVAASEILEEASKIIPAPDFKIAINSGEAALSSNDIYGDVVNRTSRLLSWANRNQILFTESIALTIRPECVEYELVARQIFKGISEKVVFYRVKSKEEKKSGETNFYPAPGSRRAWAALLDVYIAALLTFLLPTLWHIPEIYGSIFHTINLQVEDFELKNTNTVDTMFAQGKVVEFTGQSRARLKFTQRTGYYDVVAGYRSLSPAGRGVLRIADNEFKLQHLGVNVLITTKTAKSIPIQTGDWIELHHDNKNIGRIGLLTFDYIELIPVGSPAFRPRGIERSYRFINLWRATEYDDLNVHYSIFRLVRNLLLQSLIGLLFFGCTPGQALMSLRVVRSYNRQRPTFLSCLIRTISWIFFPITILHSLLSGMSGTDIISGTRVLLQK